MVKGIEWNFYLDIFDSHGQLTGQSINFFIVYLTEQIKVYDV